MSVDFTGKVYKKQVRAEYVSREIFLSEAAKSRIFPGGPIALTSADLNILEYFGLLMPVAKLIVEPEFARRKFHFSRNLKSWLNSKNYDWVVWSQNRARWMFSIFASKSKRIRKQHHLVSGRILFEEDVDYWRAFRSMRSPIPPELLQEYNQNPFDMPFLLLRDANQGIDDKGLIPMYSIKDISDFIQLMLLLHQPLPLIYSILACEESQKRVRKGKFFTPIKLKEQLWELVIQVFDKSLTEKYWIVPSYRSRMGRYINRIQPPVHIDRYFYRNHYITSYIHSLHNQGVYPYPLSRPISPSFKV